MGTCGYCGCYVFQGNVCRRHHDLPGLQAELPPEPDLGDPTIQAVDTNDETFYVLREYGKVVAIADWPQFLEDLRPDARRITCYTNEYP